MVRAWSVVFGIGLAILWIAGLSAPQATGWLTWLDGVAAVCSFIVAGAAPENATRSTKVGGTVTMAVGLFALWIIGLVTGATNWLSWWTFAFACAFTLLAISAGVTQRTMLRRTGVTEESERFRKSA